MKRVLFWVLGIIVLLMAAGVFALSRIDTQFVIREIAEATAKATGHPLVFSSAPQLSLLPPGVIFSEASWGGDARKTGMALSLRGGMAELELMPLLSGKIVIREIRLDEPLLEVHTMQTASEHVASQDESAVRQPPSDSLPVELRHLRLQNGSLRFTHSDGSHYAISGLDVTVNNLRRREEASLQCSFAFDLSQNGQCILAGQFDAAGLLRYYAPHLTFRQVRFSLRPEAGLIPGQAAPLTLACEGAIDLQTMAMRLASCSLSLPQGRLDLEGQGSCSPLAFTGKLHLDGAPRKIAALAGLNIKGHSKDTLRLQCAVEYASDSLHLRQMAIQLDDTPARGDVSLHLGSPMAVTLALQSGMVHLDQYLPLPDQKKAVQQSMRPAGQSPDPAPRGSRKVGGDTDFLPDLDVRMALAGIQYNKLTVKDISFILKGSRGRYTLTGGKASLAGGSLKASGEADLPAESYRIKAIAAGVQTGALLEAMGQTRAVEGVAALDTELHVHGSTAAELQASLNGTGVLEARDVQLKALSVLPSDMPGLTGKNSVPDRFELVRIPFTARNGEITAQPVTVTSSGLNAQGRAHVSLPRQYLNATAQVRALGMNIPVVAQGPFSNITYGVEPRFALDMARKLPEALLEAGRAAGGTARDGAQGAGQNAGDALKKGLDGAGGLIRGLLGR